MGFFKTKSRALKDVAAKIFLPVALSAALLVGTIGGVNSVFAAESESSGKTNGGKYYSDYSSLEETREASLEVNRQIAEESVVLLKNKDDTLPFSGVKYISVFGKDSADFYYAGGGSGTAEGYYDDDEYYTLDQSLADAGYQVNPVLKRFYENDTLSGSYGSGGNYVNETDPSKFTAGVLDSYGRYSDAALIVLGRTGSEGGDLYMGGYDEEGNELKHALELTDAEENLVKHVTENFDTVVVVLNVPMQMELGWIDAEEGDDEYLGDIDAAFWIGHPGLNGAIAVGETLNGTINPSGKLADIYARDFKKDPTYFNAQDNLHIKNGTTDYMYQDAEINGLVHSVEYEEGIYYGYRYYETRAAAYDGAIEGLGEKEYESGEEWYQDAVVYPFGYGLSYTAFEWEMGEVKDAEDASGDRYFEIPVTVKNTGSVAGKDVVELYYTAPYYAGEIEKSHVVLGDFAKTDLLKPGQSQTLTLKIYLQDMASYDYADVNHNNFKGYELDAGEYTLKLMTDSHNIKETAEGEELTYSFTLDADETFRNDRITGAEVNNRFTDNGSYDSFGGLEGDMTELSRNAWSDTWPTTPTSTTAGSEGTPVIELDKETFDKVNFQYTPGTTAEEEDQAWYDYFADMGTKDWTQEQDNGLTFSDMAGVAWDDAKWDKFMNQLTWDEMRNLCYNGGYKTMAIERLGVPGTNQADGPVAIKGISGTECGIQWVSGINVAATWNVELARLRGIMVGNEGLQLGLNGWYAPGLNLHRSPFGGRNFEYYSEDGVLNGKIAVAVVQGCQSKGVICFIKHFAINNQEEDRGAALPGMNMPGSSEFGLLTWASEQVVREIYLKAFQMAVEEGGALGLMSSMNHTGLRSNTNNFELLTGVLREEWGFKGYTVTDVVPASPANPYADTETLCRTGIDTILGAGNEDAGPTQGTWDANATNMWGGKGSVKVASGDQNDITYASVRNSAKRILYASVNSAAYKNGLDTSGFGAQNTLSVNIGVSSNLKVNAGDKLGTSDVQYEMTAGTLPQGLSFASDGSLEGTPVQAGTFTFTVKMIADGWVEAEKEFTLTVVNDLFETPTAAATVGTAYTGKIASEYLTENNAAVEYSVYSGELPEGLTLAADGTLSGTPLQAGEYKVVVSADATEESEDSSGSVTTTQSQYLFDLTLTVADAAKHTVTVQYGTGCAAQVETVYAGQTLTITDPVRYGYTFTGWYTDEACTTKADLSAISSDMTIYAGWAEVAAEASGCGSVIGTGSALLGAGMLLAAAAVIAIGVSKSKKKA